MTQLKRNNFRFLYRLRVRWAEVDAQKIVFNGHYLMYVDTAITDYWRALALPYPDALEQFGGDLFVKKATLEYHAPARYDDQLEIGIRCERVGTSSMTFRIGIFRQDELLITGEVVYVYADPKVQKSMPVPPELREVLTAYEQGQSMVHVKVGGWDELGEDARLVRTEVFTRSSASPRRWSGTMPTAVACTPWPTTGSGCPWPRAGCSNTCPVWRRSAAWPLGARCEAAAWGAPCWRR